tara:strand:- start:345 stop:488 length:144 start_codon:yes stop_codon:yes gene_type:complete
LRLIVDPDANYIEVDLSETARVLEELITAAVYDIDDITIEELEVEEC